MKRIPEMTLLQDKYKDDFYVLRTQLFELKCRLKTEKLTKMEIVMIENEIEKITKEIAQLYSLSNKDNIIGGMKK